MKAPRCTFHQHGYHNSPSFVGFDQFHHAPSRFEDVVGEKEEEDAARADLLRQGVQSPQALDAQKNMNKRSKPKTMQNFKMAVEEGQKKINIYN